ncbi:twitching motility protein PilT [Vibrio anguillarum]|uniref:Twitching motility protein PilT n=3 Tax=Vibrio anguillarum TaxID=55601 RepID=A0ABR9Z7J6_VIBAN|nr:twitching motility protein PilT [Vibrio anguillarum]
MKRSQMTTFTNRELPDHLAINTLKINIIDETSINDILNAALSMNCRDIYLISNDYIRGRIYNNHVILSDRVITHDEVRTLLTSMSSPTEVNRIYSGVPINNRYLLQDRHDRNKYRGFRYSFTKHSAVNSEAFDAAIRPIPEFAPTTKEIGIGNEIMTPVKEMWKGLMLFIGATGEGKSSSMAAIIRDILESPSNKRILEYARPPEYSFHNINKHPSNHIIHHEISETGVGGDLISYELANAVSMRKAADWFMVGEMTEPESFNSAITLSNTGHIVSSTLHANNCASAFSRITSLYPPNERESILFNLINEGELMIAQKLLSKTNGGLIAVREIFELNYEVKARLRQFNTAHSIGLECKKILEEQGRTFPQQAKLLLDKGLITLPTYTAFVKRC